LLTAIAQAASDGGGEGLKVVLPLIGSAIALVGVLLTLFVNGRRTERTRRRDLYSKGWAAVQAYKEFAFAVRRRNADDRAGERVRISTAMGEVQKELAYYEAMIGRERVSEFVATVTGRDHRGVVADAYLTLVAETRKVAGGIIKRSWDEDPISADSEMHAPEIAKELAALEPFEAAFLDTVSDDVGGRRPEIG
jgi:hypothetical protein